jgi:simple sugar transport system substrate-binding protein
MKNGKRLILGIAAFVLLFSAAGTFTEGAPETEAAPKPFDGVTIKFLAGGGEGDAFSSVIENGAQYAAKILGCRVDILNSNWDPETYNDDLRKAIASDPDGIVVIPSLVSPDALEAFAMEANDSGIIMTGILDNRKDVQQKFVLDGFGYVGWTEPYEEGIKLASYVYEKYNLKSGDRCVLWSLWQMPFAQIARSHGVAEYFEEKGLKVDKMNLEMGWISDPEQAILPVSTYLRANPDTKVMGGNNWAQWAGVLPEIYDSAGKKVGDLIVIGWDSTEQQMYAIQNGLFHVSCEQQQFLMGLYAVLNICLTKEFGFTGLTVNTSGNIIDDTNYQEILDLIKKGIR